MSVGNSPVAGIKPQLPSLVAEPALLRLRWNPGRRSSGI